MKRLTLLGAIGAAALTGCASDTAKIESAYVSPETYAHFDCQQIGAEFSRLTRKAEELGAVVDKMASDDQAQAFVGIVLFWPALFFLEGGETQQTQEYARLKGQLEALETASVAQGCGTDIRQVAATAGTPGGNASSRLASLKMLYRDGAITEAEYIERRKQLVDEQAKRELEMMERQKAAAAQRQGSEAQASAAPSRKMKVVILPAGRGTWASAGTTRQAEENDIFDRVHSFVKREQALEIVYSSADSMYPDHPVEFNTTRLWIGVSEKKPRESTVYATAEDLDADLILMFYWEPRTGGRTDITVYLFDVATKRMYKRGKNGEGINHVDDLLKFVFHDPLGGLALKS